MTVTGKIRNGVVVPDQPVRLPEGTEVVVLPANMPLSEEFMKFAGCMEGEYPADFAAKFDAYKRGKRQQ